MMIKVKKFEGPLGLLLKLIEKEEMDITQVSLARIADRFVSHISDLTDLDPDEMADFLVVASRLLLIKSRALLPYLLPEEEEDIEELEVQLKIYKEFLEAVKKIEKMTAKKRFMFARQFNRRAVLNNVNFFSPPRNTTSKELKESFKNLLVRLQPLEKLEEKKLEKKINIEDKISQIKQMIISRIKVSFNNFFAKGSSKTEVVVSFLAMLELIKQREVSADQEELFGEIIISKI